MNVKVESLPRSQSLVTVEIEPDRYAAAREDAFRHIMREVVIPGFRKGKAPRNLAERYVNQDLVQSETESRLMDSVWDELRNGEFKDRNFYDNPQVTVVQHNPLIFAVTLTFEPTVQLGDYKPIRIAPHAVAVTDDDVTKTIDRLRENQAQWQPVEHRPVRQGDMLTVDAHGTLGSEPVVVPQGFTVIVEEDANFIIPGFVMRLIDMEASQEKEFEVDAPEDSTNKTLAGAKGKVTVTVLEIKEKVLPALDDALAKTMGADTVDELTEKVRTSLLKGREDEARAHLENEILDAVAGVSTITFPDVMVVQQVESMLQERTEALRQQGLSMELYLRFTGRTIEQLRADARPQAETRIRNYLLVEELGHAEGIVVEDSAVHGEIDRIIGLQQDQDAARKELSTNMMHERIRNNLYVKALFDRLIAIMTEGMAPVAADSGPNMPSITDSIAGADKPADEPKEDKPKLIIASH